VTLQIGTRVCYSPEERPATACPNCELTSEGMKEAGALESYRGRVGTIAYIEDPRNPEPMRCRNCKAPMPTTEDMLCIGIEVHWDITDIMDSHPEHQFVGVWAYPSELTIIPVAAWRICPICDHRGLRLGSFCRAHVSHGREG